MVKVLVASENTRQTSEYCNYLSNIDNFKTIATNSGTETITKYHEIKPNVLVLDSNFNDIKSPEIMNRLSRTVDERKKCNVILTIDKENSFFSCVTKLYKVFNKPLNLEILSETIKQMNKENDYADLDEAYLDKLLFSMNIIVASPRADYLREAIKECYYFPGYLGSYKNILDFLAFTHNTNSGAIKSSMHDVLKPLNEKRDKLQHHPIVKMFDPTKNITPKQFIEVVVAYLHIEKGQEIIF